MMQNSEFVSQVGSGKEMNTQQKSKMIMMIRRSNNNNSVEKLQTGQMPLIHVENLNSINSIKIYECMEIPEPLQSENAANKVVNDSVIRSVLTKNITVEWIDYRTTYGMIPDFE